MKIYSLNPALSLRSVIPEGIYNNSDAFVEFIKAYYEWMHTAEFTVESISGTLLKDEAVLGQTSKTSATISQIKEANTSYVVFVTGTRPFEKFETLVGQTSGAQVRLLKIKDNVLRQADQLINYRDLNKTVDQFESYLKEELYYAIPSSYDGNKRELAKRLRDFYLSKGQEQAYRYFMKTLYDQDIEITYPGDEILRVSDGIFRQETIIRAQIIGDPGSNDIFKFLFKTIRGKSSGSIANVVDVKKISIGSYYIAEMKLSLVSGVFEAGEDIYDIADTSPAPLETTLYGIVSGYDIIDGGSGYTADTAITINGDGSDAVAQISDISIAKIDTLKLNTTGHGYRLGTLATVDNTDTGGSGLIVRVSEISNTYPVIVSGNTYTVGEITKVSVANTGSGYFRAPTITLNDSVIAAGGLITDKYINIVNSGNNYAAGDWLSFFATPGSGANADIASVDLGVQSRTNYIPNSTMVGANTISGALPTGWGIGGAGGLTVTTVGTGTENGLAYTDIQISGTTTGTSAGVRFTTYTDVSALPGEIWASSFYIKLVGGSLANVSSSSLACNLQGINSVGGITDNVFTTFIPSSTTLERKTLVVTLASPTTLYARPQVSFAYLVGVNINFTIRVAAPQLEKNYFVTDYIPTTNAAVTIAGYGEPTRINSIQNNRMLGAVAGTPGTVPTNWTGTGSPANGLVRQIVGAGTENGITYIDIKYSGTTTAASFHGINAELIGSVSAVSGQSWTHTAYLSISGGSTANVSAFDIGMNEYSITPTFLAGSSVTIPVSSGALSGKRYSHTRTLTNASTASLQPYIVFTYPSGVAIDFTLRIGMPQLEFGNTATSVIPTSIVAARRPSNEPTNDYSIYLESGDKLISEDRDYIKYNTSNTSIAEWMGIGKISRIRMTNYGSNYTGAILPTITVNTLTGSSANLVVTNIQGRGANVEVDVANNTQSIGGIRKILPINFGVAYTTANVSTVGIGDENANIIPIITGSGITAGDYVGDRGKLNYKKIQDSYYYQDYSYVIKSGIEISKYKNVLKKLLHPSGLEVFGEIQIINTLNLSLGVLTEILRKFVIFSEESLAVQKVVDFIPSELYSIYADVPIEFLQNSSIFAYQYYTFLSPVGEPIYFQIERNLKVPGSVTVYSANGNVFGSGTTFESSFSAGDLFATQDRNPFKNIIVDSEKYSTTNWTRIRSDILENQILAPFDDFYADKLVENTASNSHYFQSISTTIAANKTWTVSIYAKAEERNLFQLMFKDSTETHGFRAEFDLINFIAYTKPTYGSGTLLSQSIIDVGNGWYRCVMTGTIDSSSTQGILGVYLEQTQNNLAYFGDGSSGMYFWGAQVENSTSVTNYGGAHPNRSNKFTINTIISDTQMTVKLAPLDDVINADIYALTL